MLSSVDLATHQYEPIYEVGDGFVMLFELKPMEEGIPIVLATVVEQEEKEEKNDVPPPLERVGVSGVSRRRRATLSFVNPTPPLTPPRRRRRRQVPSRMPDPRIDMYPEQVLQKEDIEMLVDKCCRICLMDFAELDTIIRLPCLHVYHRACIQSWFDYNQTCPQDKLQV
jgi:E3 ubiquitin-protein ligase RNF115/126